MFLKISVKFVEDYKTKTNILPYELTERREGRTNNQTPRKCYIT